VVVSRPRPTVAPAANGALQLSKDADSLAEMRVGVQEIALQQIAVIVLRPLAEIELAEVFVAKSRLAAERHIPAASIEWNVLQPVEILSLFSFVAQITPVLVITQGLIRRRRWSRRLSLRESDTGEADHDNHRPARFGGAGLEMMKKLFRRNAFENSSDHQKKH